MLCANKQSERGIGGSPFPIDVGSHLLGVLRMELDEIREELLTILREHGDRWWMSYSLRHRLSNVARTALAAEYGTAIGKGGGHPHGPISHISTLLYHTDGVKHTYLETRGVSVRGREASGDRTAIFRWVG